jgi:hypothetical protein
MNGKIDLKKGTILSFQLLEVDLPGELFILNGPFKNGHRKNSRKHLYQQIKEKTNGKYCRLKKRNMYRS